MGGLLRVIVFYQGHMMRTLHISVQSFLIYTMYMRYMSDAIVFFLTHDLHIYHTIWQSSLDEYLTTIFSNSNTHSSIGKMCHMKVFDLS